MSNGSALVTTGGVESAQLPVRYEAAKRELAECERVDECATWAKKAAALASYARQADDKSLEQMAVRIRARAIRRCGELLKEIPASPGGQPTHKSNSTKGGASPSRADAAREAGLSVDQTKDALRIAKVPAEEFEDALESNDPPTIEALAERGTKKKPLVDIMGRDPEKYNRSLLLSGALNDLADSARATSADTFVDGCVPRHYKRVRENATFLSKWITNLLDILENKE